MRAVERGLARLQGKLACRKLSRYVYIICDCLGEVIESRENELRVLQILDSEGISNQ